MVISTVIELRADPPSAESQQVRVVGHQWWWEFNYPDLGITTANELVIPASDMDQSRPIYLQLEAADVIHSFWVPKLAGKTDCIPGKHQQNVDSGERGRDLLWSLCRILRYPTRHDADSCRCGLAERV